MGPENQPKNLKQKAVDGLFYMIIHILILLGAFMLLPRDTEFHAYIDGFEFVMTRDSDGKRHIEVIPFGLRRGSDDQEASKPILSDSTIVPNLNQIGDANNVTSPHTIR